MDSKIREMIRMAAADGVITEAERRIIIKKAIELGEDPDMVELAIEGELGEIKNDIDHEQAKGTKCPKCGALIPAGLVVCPDCSFSLVKNELNHTALELQKDLLMIDKEMKEKQDESIVSKLFSELTIQNWVSRKMSRITTTVIPNTRVDLLELLAFTAPKADKKAPKNGVGYGNQENLGYAYLELFNNCVMMAKHNFENDSSFKQYFDLYDKLNKSRGAISNEIKLWIGIFFIIAGVLGYGLYRLATEEDRADKREKAHEIITKCIQDHDYQGARVAVFNMNLPTSEKESLTDNIISQEVSYLVSQGRFKEAKIAALSIINETMRKSVYEELEQGEKASAIVETPVQYTDSLSQESIEEDITMEEEPNSTQEQIQESTNSDWKESVPDIPEEASKKESKADAIFNKIDKALDKLLE